MDMKAFPNTNLLARGSLDTIRGDIAEGWIMGADPVRPLVFVGSQPATLLDAGLPRPDVCQSHGMREPVNTGFRFRLPGAKAGELVRLYGATSEGVFPIAARKLEHAVCGQSFTAQLELAAKKSVLPGAVGIVCWDGAHNPIGRAMELYRIIEAGNRPAVLICFLHEEFGPGLWPPLLSWDGNALAIPWKKRFELLPILARHGVRFDTVWICKPRLPSFLLAGAVAHEKTRFILDIDDDEEAFIAAQSHSPACYDSQGLPFTNYLRDQIAAYTVANPALQDRFGGELIRHVRDKQPAEPLPEKLKIGFAGTVRPHKNIVELARAIRLAAPGQALEFHIYGDIRPAELQGELEAAGAVIHGPVPMAELPQTLAGMRVLVSGFPIAHVDSENQKMADCQIAAKISDALAAGRPILAPDGPAAADLRDITGIYLFTRENFAERLQRALRHEDEIGLPAEFTPQGAYAAFARAEEKAEVMPQMPGRIQEEVSAKKSPALLLLWKQQDAALYGRRVDQIARKHKREFPQQRVYVLEFYQEPDQPEVAGDPQPDDFCDERPLLDALMEKKRCGMIQDGVHYHTICHKTAEDLRNKLLSFLAREDLSFGNTKLMLFPVIENYEQVEDIFQPYEKVVDVVDNELGWPASQERKARLMDQYFRLLAPAEKAVFNSPINHDFFVGLNFIKKENTEVIPNWYSFPDGYEPKKRQKSDSFTHVIYSGNMNDRIDWELLGKIVALPNVRLHLAGTAYRAREKLKALIDAGAIYHGVTSERETLDLLQYMDMAVVAHEEDGISRFMNPMKVDMYKNCLLATFCPNFLGYNGVETYNDHKDCLSQING